jgi:hypothetical protein
MGLVLLVTAAGFKEGFKGGFKGSVICCCCWEGATTGFCEDVSIMHDLLGCWY